MKAKWSKIVDDDRAKLDADFSSKDTALRRLKAVRRTEFEADIASMATGERTESDN